MKPAATRRRIPRLAIAALVLVVLFGLLQLAPLGRIHNRPAAAEPAWDSAKTRTLAVAACFDCHSDQTSNHWYLHVAPISWWTANHVDEGRAALNFSEWDPANHRSGQRVAETVIRGNMPPAYYTWFGLHKNAHLSNADRQALVQGLQATIGAGAGRGGREGRDGRDGGG